MKFSVSGGELLNRLQAVGKVITGKNPLPILDNFLFSLEGNKLTIFGSDKEMTIQTTLEVTNEGEPGRVAVPCDRLQDFLKKVPEQPVIFTINPDTFLIEMSTMSGKYSIPGLNGNEYPNAPTLKEDAQLFTIDAEIFLAGLAKTAFATGDDDLRPVMNGVLVDIENECTTFVGTDSHKLVRYIRKDVKSGFNSCFVLNKKPVALLKSVINKSDGTIFIRFDKKNAIVETPNFTIQCLLINSKYPDYRSVIPTDSPFYVTVNRNDLYNSIDRVALFTDTTMLVRLDLSSNSIRVSAQYLDFSRSGDETIASQYQGEDMSLGFQSSYFKDILANMSAEDIVIGIADPSRAAVIVPSEESKVENEDELMLLMPMKI